MKSDSLGNILIISLYVDDLLITGNDFDLIQSFTIEIDKEFEMTNLGEMKYFLGIEIEQRSHGIFVSQHKYATDTLRRFKMMDCKPVDTPITANTKLSKDDGDQPANEKNYRSLVGSLLF